MAAEKWFCILVSKGVTTFGIYHGGHSWLGGGGYFLIDWESVCSFVDGMLPSECCFEVGPSRTVSSTLGPVSTLPAQYKGKGVMRQVTKSRATKPVTKICLVSNVCVCQCCTVLFETLHIAYCILEITIIGFSLMIVMCMNILTFEYMTFILYELPAAATTSLKTR